MVSKFNTYFAEAVCHENVTCTSASSIVTLHSPVFGNTEVWLVAGPVHSIIRTVLVATA
jgi:hypothetical protein